MKAIIIDDEPKAIELLSKYLQHFESIELAATFRNGFKAISYLEQNAVDLIFLDIQMPHLSGLSLSRMVGKETGIIFTTAYPEYAVESYEVNAIDYLLKPISLDRFTMAIGKLLAEKNQLQNAREILLVKSGNKIHRVQVSEIEYLKKEGNYLWYYLSESKVMSRESISEVMSSLPPWFIQIHRSYIINLRKVDFVQKDEISVGKNLLTIGNTYRDAVYAALQGGD